MEKLSMKTMDVGFQATGNLKAANQTADVSGDYDFRKMLESKNEQGKQESKEVSKEQNKDTAATDKTEASDLKEPEGVSEETGKAEQADGSETDTKQAEVMIALQMRERYSYGFAPNQDTGEQGHSEVEKAAVVLPETGAEEGLQMAETQEQAVVSVQDGAQEQQLQMPETGRVQTVKPRQALEQPEQVTNTAAFEAAETAPTIRTQDFAGAEPQTQDFTSNLKEAAETAVQPKEKTEAQPEQFAAEQAAAASAVRPETEQPVKTEVERPETAARVHVERPEELPEKVTDTLLAKLTEGVKEFEIHIEPVNLGKIAVKVLYEGSQATISIVCSEKRAMDALSQNAREIGNIIDRNLGGETTIIVDKQETDYLNQTRDENEHANQNQKQKEEKNQNQNGEDAEQFLQRLRLGLTG